MRGEQAPHSSLILAGPELASSIHSLFLSAQGTFSAGLPGGWLPAVFCAETQELYGSWGFSEGGGGQGQMASPMALAHLKVSASFLVWVPANAKRLSHLLPRGLPLLQRFAPPPAVILAPSLLDSSHRTNRYPVHFVSYLFIVPLSQKNVNPTSADFHLFCSLRIPRTKKTVWHFPHV